MPIIGMEKIGKKQKKQRWKIIDHWFSSWRIIVSFFKSYLCQWSFQKLKHFFDEYCFNLHYYNVQ